MITKIYFFGAVMFFVVSLFKFLQTSYRRYHDNTKRVMNDSSELGALMFAGVLGSITCLILAAVWPLPVLIYFMILVIKEVEE